MLMSLGYSGYVLYKLVLIAFYRLFFTLWPKLKSHFFMTDIAYNI